MLNLAKLLHYKDFHITFVNIEYNHKRLLKSKGSNSPWMACWTFGLKLYLMAFLRQIILMSLKTSYSKKCLVPFHNLLYRLNYDSTSSSKIPPVTFIVSDGSMSFTLEAAEEFGIPEVLFWTPSACGLLSYTLYHALI